MNTQNENFPHSLMQYFLELMNFNVWAYIVIIHGYIFKGYAYTAMFIRNEVAITPAAVLIKLIYLPANPSLLLWWKAFFHFLIWQL